MGAETWLVIVLAFLAGAAFRNGLPRGGGYGVRGEAVKGGGPLVPPRGGSGTAGPRAAGGSGR